jgi:hypothetical protein
MRHSTLALAAAVLALGAGGPVVAEEMRPQSPTPRPPPQRVPPTPRRVLACPECGSKGSARYCRRYGHFKRRGWMTAEQAFQRAELRAAVAGAAEEMRGIEESIEEYRRALWEKG